MFFRKGGNELRSSGSVSWSCVKSCAKPGAPSRGAAVLVHGLFLFGFCLAPLASRLRRDGYDVYLCDYPTRKLGVLEHGEAFSELLDLIAAERGESAPGSLNIVAHSLGCVVARVALAKLEGEAGGFRSLKPAMMGRVVMLAPPNKGSGVARRVSRLLPWAGRFVKPLPELSDAPGAAVHSVPAPKSFEIGVIAGTCDIEAPVPCTELSTASARKILLSDHSLMPFYPHVYRALTCFLETGSFEGS